MIMRRVIYLCLTTIEPLKGDTLKNIPEKNFFFTQPGSVTRCTHYNKPFCHKGSGMAKTHFFYYDRNISNGFLFNNCLLNFPMLISCLIQ